VARWPSFWATHRHRRHARVNSLQRTNLEHAIGAHATEKANVITRMGDHSAVLCAQLTGVAGDLAQAHAAGRDPEGFALWCQQTEPLVIHREDSANDAWCARLIFEPAR
jgi:hypothetical protein